MLSLPDIHFSAIASRLRDELISGAPIVDVGEWQSQRGGPEARTIELEDVSFAFQLPRTADDLAALVLPNRAWADEHFAERVSGIAYNPPPSAERWPFKRAGHAEHLRDGKFSHTYPERLWPNPTHERVRGIRFGYGDLQDVVELLCNRPFTRQAYIPIWFPEDTGAHHEQRVPCTLGYHAMMRNGRLKLVYYMRSCDFLRHFRDDVYLAGRLCQYLVERMNERESEARVEPGELVVLISSLHVFSADIHTLSYRRSVGKP